MTALLDVENLCAAHGQLQALFGVDLRVEKGETVAIIGANGAGKSTLLQTIAGEVAITGGTVRFDGDDLSRVSPFDRVSRGITLVPEGRRLFPSLTVEENLLIGAFRGRPGPWDMDAVYELFPLLSPLARRGAADLSGGEQQAVAIGRALMANPRLLLLDEVSLGLAPIVVQRLYQTLPSILAAGTTVVLVEQDIGQALDVADHVVCLLEGQVSLSGEPTRLDHADITAAYFGV